METGFDEQNGQFSPDGNWIALESNESGRSEVYVRPFPRRGEQLQISHAGGAQARWREDGRELFYIALDGQLMAVPIEITSDRALQAGTPSSLFPTRVGGAIRSNQRQTYIVSEDGQRFLMNTLSVEAPPPLAVILNWTPP